MITQKLTQKLQSCDHSLVTLIHPYPHQTLSLLLIWSHLQSYDLALSRRKRGLQKRTLSSPHPPPNTHLSFQQLPFPVVATDFCIIRGKPLPVLSFCSPKIFFSDLWLSPIIYFTIPLGLFPSRSYHCFSSHIGFLLCPSPLTSPTPSIYPSHAIS